MAILRLLNPSPPLAHEDVMLARYDRLLTWALPLVEGDATAAEDLLHDVFLQFTLARPDLDAIENLDAYLRQMLRNLRVSQVRRAAQRNEQSLCSADFDSAALRWQSDETQAGLSAREELQLIAQYALARRFQSKAASVLLLRFFHGYLPSEIARLMRLEESAGRGAVKQWLSLARRETRQYLHEPQSLKFLGLAGEMPSLTLPVKVADDEFLPSLRTAIFAAPQPQVCLHARQWKAIYRATETEALHTALLAHLVCCATCLAQINSLLGLNAQDAHFPDDPSDSGSTKQSQNKVKQRRNRGRHPFKAAERHRAETLEHQPTELHVYANGFCVATHTVEAVRNRLSLKLHLDEPLAFVEIFSEQGVRLLYLPVGETPALKQNAHLELSEQRSLDATLHFVSTWPTLELNYTECGVRSAECGVEEVGECGLLIVDCEMEDSAHSTPSLFAPLSQSQGLLDKLKSAIRNPHSAFSWLLRPVTITVLLTALLLVVVVGQKRGWWFAPAKPTASPAKRDTRQQSSAVSVSPSVRPGSTPNANTSSVAPLPAPTVAPVTATATLEIEALQLLRQAKADTHEQIEVRRTSDGKLRIEGLLESDARKTELLQALSSLRNHPAVEIQLQTVAEAARKLRPTATVPNSAVIEREEVTVAKLPLDAELRRYFTARGISEARLDEEMQRFAATTLSRSRQAARHAGALKNLANRFANSEALESVARQQWRALLAEHARALHAELLALRATLKPVFSATAGNESAGVTALQSDADLRRAIASVASLCAETDRALIAAFSLSSESSPGVAVKTTSFWAKLQQGQNLAAAINQYLSNSQ